MFFLGQPVTPEMEHQRRLAQAQDFLLLMVHKQLGAIPKTLADLITTTRDLDLLHRRWWQIVSRGKLDESMLSQILQMTDLPSSPFTPSHQSPQAP
jgi:hypothetical protein